MENLKQLLKTIPNNKESFPHWFQEIAKLLLNNYHIESSFATYRFTEIEFYYYSENHQDESTYGYSKDPSKLIPRIKRQKEAQKKSFTWFFHYSGIDISIGNGTNPGGILIRGIEKIGSPKEIFDGPLKVQLELLNQGVSVLGETHIQLKLLKNNANLDSEIYSRLIVGISSGGFQDKYYNFSVFPLKNGEKGEKIS